VSIEKDFQTYEGIAEQVEVLAAQLKGEHFDVMLVITRGGMIPGAILGYRRRSSRHANVFAIPSRSLIERPARAGCR
jgi:hypoxanthine phosphoribosyltransferase